MCFNLTGFLGSSMIIFSGRNTKQHRIITVSPQKWRPPYTRLTGKFLSCIELGSFVQRRMGVKQGGKGRGQDQSLIFRRKQGLFLMQKVMARSLSMVRFGKITESKRF